MKLGLSRDETLTVPFSLLLDLIAVEQIKNEGAEQKLSAQDEEAEFFRLLSYQ